MFCLIGQLPDFVITQLLLLEQQAASDVLCPISGAEDEQLKRRVRSPRSEQGRLQPPESPGLLPTWDSRAAGGHGARSMTAFGAWGSSELGSSLTGSHTLSLKPTSEHGERVVPWRAEPGKCRQRQAWFRTWSEIPAETVRSWKPRGDQAVSQGRRTGVQRHVL